MNDRNRPLYMISVAAELAGVHPQTLRTYEQKGLVTPQRTSGNTRMYSQADIERLELINELTGEGINACVVWPIACTSWKRAKACIPSCAPQIFRRFCAACRSRPKFGTREKEDSYYEHG